MGSWLLGGRQQGLLREGGTQPQGSPLPEGIFARGLLRSRRHCSLALSSGSHTGSRIPRRAPLIGRLRQVGPADQSAAARPGTVRSAAAGGECRGRWSLLGCTRKRRPTPVMTGVPHIQPGTPLALPSHQPFPSAPRRRRKSTVPTLLLGFGFCPHAPCSFCASCSSCSPGAPTFRSSCSFLVAHEQCSLSLGRKTQCSSTQTLLFLPTTASGLPSSSPPSSSCSLSAYHQQPHFDQIWWRFILFAAALLGSLDSVDVWNRHGFQGLPLLSVTPPIKPFSMHSQRRDASQFP